MQALIHALYGNPMLLLFAVVGLGYLLGSVRVLGFSLGVSAVLFTGLAVGALDPSLALPDYVYILGLVLFVYAVGLTSGPGFFASFQRRGLRINVVAGALVVGGAIVAVVLSRLLRIPGPFATGLFCGALTTTPGLAATVETLKQMAAHLPADQAARLTNSPVVAYGLAYPFGVLGVLLAFALFVRLFRIDFAREEAERRRAAGEHAIETRTYRATNPALEGQTVEQALALLGEPGFVVSRIRREGRAEVAVGESRIEAGDEIRVVGTADSFKRARLLFGEEVPEVAPPVSEGIAFRRIFVSSRDVVGRTIAEVQLQKRFHATITRLRRGDVDFVPSQGTVLELGDQIRVVAPQEDLKQVSRFFGDSMKSLSEMDFLSMSLGIVLGVLVGMIPIPLGGGLSFRLGFAGGPLIVALILGRLERTGPINWGMPLGANLALRQLGLVFFLAAIGTRAGHGLGDTFAQGGWVMVAAGALITAVVAVAGVLAGYRYLGLPMSAVMGLVAGIQTQPACLAFAAEQTGSDAPSEWYASVYPVSMVAKILLAQLLISAFLRP